VTGFLVLGGTERMLTREERIDGARDDELVVRKQGARRERAKVTVQQADGGPPVLTVAGREPGAPFQVTLRGPLAELPSCSCADFARNELQTCKHVERVLRSLVRRRIDPPSGILSVWWQPRDWHDRASRGAGRFSASTSPPMGGCSPLHGAATGRRGQHKR
jgi:hypothetical protein